MIIYQQFLTIPRCKTTITPAKGIIKTGIISNPKRDATNPAKEGIAAAPTVAELVIKPMAARTIAVGIRCD
ncbi:MAG: hypothetical protein HC836_47810 [Richelia sp. RM2_1_2]|nr:hypothetical protein [Richelia sp. RM2_1_2]